MSDTTSQSSSTTSTKTKQPTEKQINKFKKKSLQTEVDASYLYAELAAHEADPNLKSIYAELSEIEGSHVLANMKVNHITEAPKPSTRAKILNWIGKTFGYDFVLNSLLETERNISNSIQKARKKYNQENGITDTAHTNILSNIVNNKNSITSQQISKFEKQHKTIGGNALRAAVLGGNDGLVSNFSLVMGVAGAMSGRSEILITGLAGLLAGSLSMALGEWISVKSSQELYENQMELEKNELELNPQAEERELALIYRSNGMNADEAKKLAHEVITKDKENAYNILVREELGINVEELEGSPMEAAITSFIFFALGAIIPVIPYFFTGGNQAIMYSIILSAIGLFLIGAFITLFTGKNVWMSGFRQVLFGIVAAALTYGLGKILGVAIG